MARSLMVAVAGAAWLAVLVPAVEAQTAEVENGVVMRAMKDENARSIRKLQLGDMEKPYYVAYSVEDIAQIDLEAVMGSIVIKDFDRARTLTVTVRVGDHERDNTNFFGGFDTFRNRWRARRALPLTDDYDAIRREFWLATDIAYKSSVEEMENKKAALKTQTESEEKIGDFSREETLRHVSPQCPPELRAIFDSLVAKAEKLSGVFRRRPAIQQSAVRLMAHISRRYFVDSDGAAAYEPRTATEVWVRAAALAEDGMPLQNRMSWAAHGVTLPEDKEMVQRVAALADELEAMRKAPAVEQYTGPVLFEDQAAAALFGLLVGPAVGGTPPPKVASAYASYLADAGGPFEGRLHTRVLPPEFSLYDDPTIHSYKKQPLLGYYAFDLEGVAPRKTQLVRDGKLIGYLMSRTPRKEFSRSTGHARDANGSWHTARFANLIVKAKKGLQRKKLRSLLLQEAADEGYDYGLIVRRLEMGRRWSRSEGLAPLLVVKLYKDGHEELVRGATISQLRVRDLKRLLGWGSANNVLSKFNRKFDYSFSVASPDLLLDDVEVRKTKIPERKQPRVPHPSSR